MNEHYEKWDLYAPRGLILIGFGFTLIMRAAHVRNQKKGFLRWVIQFLIGLVSINSGIALFGEAVKERALYEIDVKELRKQDAQAAGETVTE